MNYDDLFDEDEQVEICPACYSEEVEEQSEFDRNYALGLYQIYGFVGNMPQITQNYRCRGCGYEW